MRLIDADALMKWANDHYDFEVFTVGYFVGIIQDMPTVDAIPMAWIENYVKNAGPVSVYNVQSIEFMLRKWRKERKEE